MSRIIGDFSLPAPRSCRAIRRCATEFGSKMVAACSHSVRPARWWVIGAAETDLFPKRGPCHPGNRLSKGGGVGPELGWFSFSKKNITRPNLGNRLTTAPTSTLSSQLSTLFIPRMKTQSRKAVEPGGRGSKLNQSLFPIDRDLFALVFTVRAAFE